MPTPHVHQRLHNSWEKEEELRCFTHFAQVLIFICPFSAWGSLSSFLVTDTRGARRSWGMTWRANLCLAAPLLCLLWLPEQPADPVLLAAPEEVRAALGGSASVSCHYHRKYSDYTKYWCKGKIYELCTIVAKTPRKRWSNRTSIQDNKQRGFFTVTMTFLEERDEDVYWCVIARTGRNIYSGVRLRLSHAGRTHILRFTQDRIVRFARFWCCEVAELGIC